jgi:protein O-GlcNAc transferase
MGQAQLRLGRFKEAIESNRRALKLKANLPIAHLNLAHGLRDSGDNSQAIAEYRRAIELEPRSDVGYIGLAGVLMNQGQLEETIAVCRKAIEINPNSARAYLYLGTALQAQGRLEDAIAAYRHSIRLEPRDAQAHGFLGAALSKCGLPDEAIAAFAKALELKPDLAQIHTNIVAAYKDRGQLDEAIASCRRAMELQPANPRAQSNLILIQNYHPDYTAKMLLEETQRWAQRHAQPLGKAIQPHHHDRSSQRRLRIGYVSADIYIHPVGRFLLPLLAHHDHQNFQVHCYSDTQQIDFMTADARRMSDGWHETAGLSDAALAEQIRADQIDILIDLSLHTGSRLLVFARKPAPVQATWLGYPGTTGLREIDYRISDPYIDPVGQTESDYVERTIRIPSYWCYQPIEPSPAVSELPAQRNGWITFGCLSNFSKVTAPALEMWAGVMNQTPDSRLLLTSNPGQHRQRVKRSFENHDIDPQRIQFLDRIPIEEYLAKYGEIDIALDTTPFAGGTTTCDAIWMGVPVVTLAGRTAVGRSGVSLLSNVGFPELIAQSPQQYIEIAVELAKDLPRLAKLRSGLREKMQRSPLMDVRRFAADMEAAYRQMWIASSSSTGA